MLEQAKHFLLNISKFRKLSFRKNKSDNFNSVFPNYNKLIGITEFIVLFRKKIVKRKHSNKITIHKMPNFKLKNQK